MSRLTKFRSVVVTSAAVSVRAGATRLKGYHIINTHSSIVYVKFYDAISTDVTVGATVPVLNIAIPVSGAMVEHKFPGEGFPFDKGCTVTAVTGVDDDSTDVAASLPVITLSFD